jgi:hypothetical protein
MADALSTDLNATPVTRAKAKPPAVPKEETLAQRMETFLAPAQQEMANVAAQEQKFKLAQDIDLAARTSDKGERIAEASRAEARALETAPQREEIARLEKEENVPFTPTQDNVKDLATIFSLIGVIGFAIGVGGKNNAMAAMSAMNGMAEGYQQGRMDLYKREKDIFDENLKQLKNRTDSLYKQLEVVTKLAATNRRAAEEEANALFAKEGATFLKEYAAKYGLPKSLELAKENLRSREKLFEMVIKQEEIARQKETDRKNRLAQLQPSFTFIEKDGKVFALNNKNPADIRQVSGDLAGGIKAFAPPTKGGGAQVTSERVMQQDIGNAVFNLKDLAALGKSEGKIPGGSVAFANTFKGDLTADIRRYIETQVIDPNPQTIDALMTNLAFDIASAQTGGRGQLSDTKVKAVVSQMPLESQPEETKKARWRAVLVRVEEANKTLPESKQIEIPKAVMDYFGGSEPSAGKATYKEGDTSTSKSGKPIVFRNGKWEYQ